MSTPIVKLRKAAIEYFQKYEDGTIYEVMEYMKTYRISIGPKKNGRRRGLEIPSKQQMTPLLKSIGAVKIGRVQERGGKILLWGRPGSAKPVKEDGR